MRGFVFILLAVLCAQVALAQTGTINLLAVSENPDGSTTGTLASLSLDVRPGAEHVFLETIPLTQLATQISMRFAQQIACKELDVDCSRQDFVYTISSGPGLVGGPSAGAAAAVLTASMLKGWYLRQDMAITGTINSGGLIGPVGGVKEKIEAAGSQGITTVLVPKGTHVVTATNQSLDLTAWGKRNNVTVIEVETLEEALRLFTGKNATTALPAFTIDPAYQQRMHDVAALICRRMDKLENVTAGIVGDDNITTLLRDDARNNTKRAIALGDDGAFYSAASYCFRANVDLNELNTLNITSDQLSDRIHRVFDALAVLNNETEGRKLNTMTDLQAYLSVQERIEESADDLVTASTALQKDRHDDAVIALVYSEERLVSARSWTAFFDLPGQPLVLDQNALKASCLTKISEAEERFAYVRTYFPDALGDTRVTLDRAHNDALNQSYALCLSKAAKAKAEADVILGVSGYEENQVDGLIDFKQMVAQRELARAEAKGDFPLIGYNYYQYANDLKSEDKYSALLFSEYAIELSNLDIYFAKPQSSFNSFFDRQVEVDNLSLVIIMLVSATAGAAFALVYMMSKPKKSAVQIPMHKRVTKQQPKKRRF